MSYEACQTAPYRPLGNVLANGTFRRRTASLNFTVALGCAGFSCTDSLIWLPCDPTYAMRLRMFPAHSCFSPRFQPYITGVWSFWCGSYPTTWTGVGNTKFEATGKETGNGLFSGAQPVLFWQYGSLNGPRLAMPFESKPKVICPTCGLNGVR